DAAGRGGSTETDDAYRALENFFYRGEMNADFVAGQTEPQDVPHTAEGGGSSEPTGARGTERSERRVSPASDAFGGGRSLPSVVEEILAIDAEAQPVEDDGGGERVRRYPEWDYRL